MKLWELYQEEKTSTVSHNGRLYSVNKLLRFADDVTIVDYDIDDLKWILKHEQLDPERVAAKQVKYPILVTKNVTSKNGDKGKLVTLDGIHRLKKAIDRGDKKIAGKYITQDMLEKSRLH